MEELETKEVKDEVEGEEEEEEDDDDVDDYAQRFTFKSQKSRGAMVDSISVKTDKAESFFQMAMIKSGDEEYDSKVYNNLKQDFNAKFD